MVCFWCVSNCSQQNKMLIGGLQSSDIDAVKNFVTTTVAENSMSEDMFGGDMDF